MVRFDITTTLQECAFWALVATVFCITFSIALGQLFAAACLLLFLIALSRGQVRLPFPPVMFFVVPFVVLAIALSFHYGDIQGLWRRCGKLFWFLLIPVTASLTLEHGRKRTILWAFLAGCAVLGLKDLVVYPVMAWRKPVGDLLTSLIDKGSMTDGQMLMLGVVGSTYLIVAMIREGRRVPWWCWSILVAQGMGLLINFKRGSWFCAILLAGAILLMQLRWRAWLLALVVLFGFFLLPPVQSRMGALAREFNSEGGGRMTMWFKITPQLIREQPQGIGYGCLTNERMRQAFRRVEPNRNHLHANWAQVLVETGWVGLALYLAWMIRSLRDGVARARISQGTTDEDRVTAMVVVLLLTGLILNGLVEYNFGDTEMMFIYAVVMGLAATGGRSSSRG